MIYSSTFLLIIYSLIFYKPGIDLVFCKPCIGLVFCKPGIGLVFWKPVSDLVCLQELREVGEVAKEWQCIPVNLPSFLSVLGGSLSVLKGPYFKLNAPLTLAHGLEDYIKFLFLLKLTH